MLSSPAHELVSAERPHPIPTSGDFLAKLNQSRIPCLDGLRGIAAYLVVAFHLHLWWDPLGLWEAFAVDVFFLLSGFLITHLLIREFEHTRAVSLRNFYIRRTLRLFPAFYASWVFVILAAIAVKRHFHPFEPIASFVYMGDYYLALTPPAQIRIMVVTWSLGIEEKFYLLWPLIFVRYAGNWSRLLKICAVLIGVVCAHNLVLAHWFKASDQYMRFAFDTRVDVILLGCALALATRVPAGRALLRTVSARALYIPVTLIMLIGLLVAYDTLKVSDAVNRYYSAYVVPLEVVLIACLLVQLIAWADHPFVRPLDSKPMVFLGTMSYGIYLYHSSLMNLAHEFVMPYTFWKVFILIQLLAPLAVAYVSYRLVEKPLLDRKKRFAARTS